MSKILEEKIFDRDEKTISLKKLIGVSIKDIELRLVNHEYLGEVFQIVRVFLDDDSCFSLSGEKKFVYVTMNKIAANESDFKTIKKIIKLKKGQDENN